MHYQQHYWVQTPGSVAGRFRVTVLPLFLTLLPYHLLSYSERVCPLSELATTRRQSVVDAFSSSLAFSVLRGVYPRCSRPVQFAQQLVSMRTAAVQLAFLFVVHPLPSWCGHDVVL